MIRRTALLALLLTGGSPALLAGCNSSSAASDADGASPPGDMAVMAQNPDLAPAAKPIEAPKKTWTFVPIEGAVCDDGTPTGIGVYIGDSPNLLVFLAGGGACWNWDTCVRFSTSTHGPFGKPQFDLQVGNAAGQPDTVFSEDRMGPFAGWSKVFVPYCTGDIHGGDSVQTYKDPNSSDTATLHHKGYSNVTLALARLGATFPSPANLVWSGSSAGGFGASINYPQARTTWSKAKSYLLDDSGPVLVGEGVRDVLKKAWTASWGLEGTLLKLCPDCAGGDWSLAYSMLATTYPNDRMALLETEADQVISSYLLVFADFKMHLYTLATMRLDPTANFRYFIEPGTAHTMLGDISKHTVNGVNVGDWIRQMTTDDAGWKSVKP